MVPADLVERWEVAYRRYCDVVESARSSVATARIAARALAVASRDVAVAWRQLGLQPGLPWWALAAVGSAAQAFELQAEEWINRADQTRPVDFGGPTRPLGGQQPW
jgi:hypothetical protein